MPFIRFHGIEEHKVSEISKDFTDDLQKLIGCARDAISLEVLHSTFILDNKVVSGIPMVEILSMDRGKESQDKVFELLRSYLSKVGVDKARIYVTHINPDNYYKY